MTSRQELIVHPTPDTLAAAVAARFLTAVIDAQAARGVAHISLTGGTIANATYAAILASSAVGAINWSAVEFWWSDERFLNSGDPDRNETGVRKALLDHIDVVEANVHYMPRLDGPLGDDVDAAAASYAAELANAGRAKAVVFDVSLLGIGPDCHCASLFPGRREQFSELTCLAVRDSPKPPPTRTTFNMHTIARSREVWVIASGADKSDAVKKCLGGLSAIDAPAGAARGLHRTLLLADAAAASEVS